MLWNPFSTDADNSPPNPAPGATALTRELIAPSPYDQSTRLLRDIFGVPPPRRDDYPTTPNDPNINFEACGGMEEQIDYVRRNVMWVMNNKEQFDRWGVDPVKGIIFYGPPGSGLVNSKLTKQALQLSKT